MEIEPLLMVLQMLMLLLLDGMTPMVLPEQNLQPQEETIMDLVLHLMEEAL